jgi:alpha,alpha-trehalase
VAILLKKQVPKLHVDVTLRALEYISSYWPALTKHQTTNRDTLIGLPHPYIIPSPGNDHFSFEEQYYWDSFFTSLGLNDEMLVTGMLDNLIYMFDKFGLIPNANRYYFTSRSQPPILTTFIFHVYHKYNKPRQWLADHISKAKQEYLHVWMRHEHPQDHNVFEGLSRYYDINNLHDLAEAESGWDMTPRFKRQCLDFIPIDLNCLLYKYEADFAESARLLGNETEAHAWETACEKRKQTIDEYLWSGRKRFYFDYNYLEGKQGTVWSLAAYYALWCGVADNKQARALVNQLEKFEKKGGLTTTGAFFMYPQLFGSTKTQWAYPNGWAPLHLIVIEGLENYGYKQDAERIAKKWLKTCLDWYEQHGEFLEKYNVVQPDKKPEQGVYPSQAGFGWTNGVFHHLANKYILS